MSTVSIIIPAYNQAAYLGQAIESALAQTHTAVEVVVIDDGATDDTPEVAGRYAADPRFRYVRQDNTGLPGARNRGILEARGDYLSFLDADDYYLPEKTARQVAILDADPDVGFVYCDITTVDGSGTPVADQWRIASHALRELSGNIARSLLLGGYFPPHTVLIRRSVFDAVGPFDPNLGGNADYEMWLRASGAGFKAVSVAEALACYRRHDDSMSHDGLHMRETRAATFRKIVRLYPDAVAEGLDHLQQLNRDLHDGNRWLRQQCDALPPLVDRNEALVRENATLTRSLAELQGTVQDGQVHGPPLLLLDHLDAATLVEGRRSQLAIWEAAIDGPSCRAIFLHPPAELRFEVASDGGGVFSTAPAVHPDAWDKPGAGGCEFRIGIDERVALSVSIDPTHIPADRRWHPVRVPIPGPAGSTHCLSLVTPAIGGADHHRWALWLAPQYTGGRFRLGTGHGTEASRA